MILPVQLSPLNAWKQKSGAVKPRRRPFVYAVLSTIARTQATTPVCWSWVSCPKSSFMLSAGSTGPLFRFCRPCVRPAGLSAFLCGVLCVCGYKRSTGLLGALKRVLRCRLLLGWVSGLVVRVGTPPMQIIKN